MTCAADPFKNRCLALALNLVRKETIRLQRIPPNTIWDPARVDTIETLSGFYVQNFDPDVRDRFSLMLQELEYVYSQPQCEPMQHVLVLLV